MDASITKKIGWDNVDCSSFIYLVTTNNIFVCMQIWTYIHLDPQLLSINEKYQGYQGFYTSLIHALTPIRCYPA